MDLGVDSTLATGHTNQSKVFIQIGLDKTLFALKWIVLCQVQ